MPIAWIGNIAITALALANIALWFVFLPLAEEMPKGYNRHLTTEIIHYEDFNFR